MRPPGITATTVHPARTVHSAVPTASGSPARGRTHPARAMAGCADGARSCATRQSAPPTPRLGRRWWLRLLLKFRLEIYERRDTAFRILVDPPVVNQSNRHRVEEVKLLPSRLAGEHKARVLQQAQVLHDSETCHLHLGLELGQASAVALEQLVEQVSSCRVGERPEDKVIVGHPRS